MANACAFSVVIRWGVSEDGVDLYLCLDGMAWDIFFGSKHNKQVGVTFSPGCFFGVCFFQKKEVVFFFVGGGGGTFLCSF